MFVGRRVTRMPMMVTAATLPGNPIIFANAALITLSDYPIEGYWAKTRT